MEVSNPGSKILGRSTIGDRIMAMRILEAAERKRDIELTPYQFLKFLSQNVFLRPGLASVFPFITSYRKRYFPLRIIWPKYSNLPRFDLIEHFHLLAHAVQDFDITWQALQLLMPRSTLFCMLNQKYLNFRPVLFQHFLMGGSGAVLPVSSK